MKACFFARVPDVRLLDKMSFYSDDRKILEEMGYEIVIATQIKDIPFKCNLYFIWWLGWGIFPLLVSKLSRSPNVVVSAVHYQDRKFGFLSKPLYERVLMRCTARFADAVLAISRIEFDGLLKLGTTHPHMVYLGIQAPAAIAPWAARKNIVFSIGHLNYRISIDRKGFDNVIRAIPLVAKAVPDVHFVMAGSKTGSFDPKENTGFYLDKLAAELGVSDRVTFPGQIDNETRARYLAKSRVLAQPAEWEGFGLAQLEAMAAGLPVVTSDAGAVSEVVGSTGLYCNKESPKDIAEKIIHLLDSQEEWEKYSRRAYQRAKENFPLEARRDKIKDILDSLTNR